MITSCLFDDAGSVCYSLQNMRAFFAACQQRGLFAAERGSEGLFWAGPVVQGPGVDWQYPVSLVVSTPFFLAAQRRTASTVKKKLPKGTPWKGFLWTLPETEGPRSLWHPGATRHGPVTSRALLRTVERLLVGGTTDLLDQTRRKANFLWKFLCAGGVSLDCGGDPIPTAVPPQGFLQSKNALRRRKTVGLLLGSLIVVRAANRFAAAIQNESAY